MANGITTAADFTGISYGTGSEVLINLRNGRRVHPSGIGEVKAVALETWRREVEAQVLAGRSPLRCRRHKYRRSG